MFILICKLAGCCPAALMTPERETNGSSADELELLGPKSLHSNNDDDTREIIIMVDNDEDEFSVEE